MKRSLCLAVLSVSALAPAAFAQGTLYGLDSTGSLFSFNLNTAQPTLLGPISPNVGPMAGLAYDRDSDTMYLTSTGTDSLYRLDLTTRTLTLVGAFGDPALIMHGLEWDNYARTLYGGSEGKLYRIDPTTGAATLIGPSGFTGLINLGYDLDNDVLYATSSSTFDNLYTINRATGAATLVGPMNGPTNVQALAFDTYRHRMYALCNALDNLYTLDLATGAATLVGPLGIGNWLGLAYVPEPCSTADFNGDGDFGTDADIEAFFACLAGSCCETCFILGPDFNADSDSGTDADIEAFFRVLAGNPC